MLDPASLRVRPRVPLRTRCLTGVALAILLAGCATPRGISTGSDRAASGSRDGAPAARAPAGALGGTVATWRGEEITWQTLKPALLEIGGATALRDELLDRRIATALAERKLSVNRAAIDAERQLLLDALDPDPVVAQRLLDEIRARQGLGPTRFDALLRRNAGLRLLVQTDLTVSASAIAEQFEFMHGPRRRCRVIAVSTLAEADGVRRELDAGASFADLAAQRSTDASAARGGLLSPISRADPSWPKAFRDSLFALSVGETSPPTLVESGYVLIRLEAEIPGDGRTLDESRREAEAALRRAQERILMERLARTYIAELNPVIADREFDAVWKAAR